MADDTRVSLFCKRCQYEHMAAGEVPLVCPECHFPTKWLMSPQTMALTRDDRAFLKVNKIRAE